VFTAEIGSWYKRDRFTVFDITCVLDIRFEPYVGGRLLEVHDRDTGEGRELGRVVHWEPGRRLRFTDNHDAAVEVSFTPVDGGTRVTLVHGGFDRLPPEEAAQVRRYGWRLVLVWFGDHLRATATATKGEE
jgi:uncharacterized protein YndB with AHSA1/START domain